MRYLHVQQLQNDGEFKIHKLSTENNPSNLIANLETAKITKHSETIGLHTYLGNKASIDMISHRVPLRPRGRYSTTPRASTPQTRLRKTTVDDVTLDDCTVLEQQRRPRGEEQELWIVEQQQYYGDEAAENDVNNNENNNLS
eukprot:774268-Amphidinium_carterae.1